VNNLDGLDPVDRWLNSRPGKQRALLDWFQTFMLGWYPGLLGWLAWALFGSPSLIVLPLIALAAAVLAVPFRHLIPALYAWRSRRHPSKTGPEFTWRGLAIGILFGIDGVLSAVNVSVGQSLPRGLQLTLASVQVIVVLLAAASAFTMIAYARRYEQARLRRLASPPSWEDSSRHPLPITPRHPLPTTPRHPWPPRPATPCLPRPPPPQHATPAHHALPPREAGL
jgi:hypothetical protein